MKADVNRMLKRAADCEMFLSLEDHLSQIVGCLSPESELSESVLDQVAAAVKGEPVRPDTSEQQVKK